MKKENIEKRFSEGRKIERTISSIQPSLMRVTGDESFSIIELSRETWTS